MQQISSRTIGIHINIFIAGINANASPAIVLIHNKPNKVIAIAGSRNSLLGMLSRLSFRNFW